jgi:hypothetical protein
VILARHRRPPPPRPPPPPPRDAPPPPRDALPLIDERLDAPRFEALCVCARYMPE